MFLREPLLFNLAMALLAFLLGYRKGLGQWGLLLGLLFGPIGVGVIIMLPSRKPPPAEAAGPPEGPACSRCGRAVTRRDKVCPHCGNLLIPVRYRVRQ